MVSYGLLKDEDSFDSTVDRPQPRKRAYPIAFPHDEHRDLYPYRDTASAAQGDSRKLYLPVGSSVRTAMDCFVTALGWIRYAIGEYGGKLFASGINEFYVTRF
jgi:hypothetical protein